MAVIKTVSKPNNQSKPAKNPNLHPILHARLGWRPECPQHSAKGAFHRGHNCERLFSHFSSRGDTSTGGGATAFLFERSSPSVVVLPPRVQISCCGTCTRTGCMFAARQSRRKRCQSPTTVDAKGGAKKKKKPG